MDAGLLVVSALAAVLLALGFIGLAHALVEGLLGEGEDRGRKASPRSARAVSLLAAVAGAGLLALTLGAYALPSSGIVEALTGGGA
jgi:hypothetical protein